MNPSLRIRGVTVADRDAAERIMRACWDVIAAPDRISAAELQRVQAHLAANLVTSLQTLFWIGAAMDGALAGVAAMDGCNLEELWVHPSYHRSGIGTLLFNSAAERLKAQHCSRMKVTTTGFARRFYEAMGMTVTGSQPVTCGPLLGRNLVALEKTL